MRSKTYDGLKQWNVHIEYSKDGARTWQRTPPIPFQVSSLHFHTPCLPTFSYFFILNFFWGGANVASLMVLFCLQGRIIQPALFLDSNGSVCMLARQRGHGEGKAATDVQQSRIVFAKSNR
jgi:hypothetical protein